MTPDGMYWSGTMLMQHVPGANAHVPDKIVLSLHIPNRYDHDGTYLVTTARSKHLRTETRDFETARQLAYTLARLEGKL
jgi:hypothetical protein